MDAGGVATTQSVSKLPAAIFAQEATDTHDNAAFDLIGSLGGLSSSTLHTDFISQKNSSVQTSIDRRQEQLTSSATGKADQKNGLSFVERDLALDGLANSLGEEQWRSDVGKPINLLPAGFVEGGKASALPKSLDSGDSDSGGGTNPAFDITASVDLVSDYRFRGISLSDRDLAAQGHIELSHTSGLYAGVWGTSLKNAPADVELDMYAGWRGQAGPFDLDAGAVAYVYPGASDLDYFEFTASVAMSLGPAELKLGTAYAPGQAHIGGDDNFYAFGELEVGVPNTPVNLTAHLGHEDGVMAGPTGQKWDWSLGAEVVVDHFTLGLSYVDTNTDQRLDPGKLASAGVVASLKFNF